MPSDKSSSNPSAQTILNPDLLVLMCQFVQVSLQINIIQFILHIISYLSSSQRYIQALQQGSVIISHIRVHNVYYETYALLSSNKLKINDRDKLEQVNVIILYKYVIKSNTFLFKIARPKIGYS